MTYLAILGFMCLLGILVGAIRLASDVRAIRDEVLPNIILALRSHHPSPAYRIKSARHIGHGTGHTSSVVDDRVFVIWEWREGQWKLRGSEQKTGFHPGYPPDGPGAFEGDLVKKLVLCGSR